ncbi:ABC transporter ATP-binding protein [Methylovirgula sp. 4M-Z18]|uniref:ABC transporter ATP-binding protein n=1 Tax=Methylovirgula sp. 4M-Z18 TaxID=2293567 RepID=UPI000E2FC48E|nr:ABC transporter ATP-binding protein [Methylovirgula sp. 4M-Z18]RFB75694.1 ABC transporter ATP-binding protein [Methylovirgula sp. 4M-Z18]
MSQTDRTLALNWSNLQLVRRIYMDFGRTYRWRYVMALLCMVTAAAAGAYAVSLLSPFINNVRLGQEGRVAQITGGMHEIRQIAFTVAILYCLRGFTTFGQMLIMSRIGNRIVARAQAQIYNHLLGQNVGFFQARQSTDFMTRLVTASNGLRDTMQLIVTSVGRDLCSVIGYVAVMFYHEPVMTMIAISGGPIGALLMSRVIRRVRHFARRSYDGTARILATMQETVIGIRIVKSFNLENIMRVRMQNSVRDVEKAMNRIALGSAVTSPVSETLGGVVIAAVLVYAGWDVEVRGGELGQFVAFLGAMMLAYEPGKRLGKLRLDMQNGLMGARLIYEILDKAPVEVDDNQKPRLQVTEGRITFHDVAFGYRATENVLNGLSFTAEPSTTTALVGPSGGGKSTIISLIQRFYDPQAGMITVDGEDVQNVGIHSLREKIAFVSQDVFLFQGTIRENIALGRAGASEEDIIAAAKHAHAHDFITGFASGYDTPVGEQGAQLSGGQRQRIAIARAILKNAPIILLDEPTAALDSESEREVQKALDDLRIGRTTLVVAHRLQTIVNADRICVIEKGHCVEQGTHDELLEKHGSYYAFFSAQFGDNVRMVTKLDAPRTEPSAVRS